MPGPLGTAGGRAWHTAALPWSPGPSRPSPLLAGLATWGLVAQGGDWHHRGLRPWASGATPQVCPCAEEVIYQLRRGCYLFERQKLDEIENVRFNLFSYSFISLPAHYFATQPKENALKVCIRQCHGGQGLGWVRLCRMASVLMRWTLVSHFPVFLPGEGRKWKK